MLAAAGGVPDTPYAALFLASTYLPDDCIDEPLVPFNLFASRMDSNNRPDLQNYGNELPRKNSSTGHRFDAEMRGFDRRIEE